VTEEASARIKRWIPPCLVAAAITFDSSCSHVAMPAITNFDKVAHFAVFGFLGTLVCRAGGPKWPAWLAVLIVSAFGVTDEWHQSFVPGRTCDVFDWLSDTLGAALAVTVYVKWAWYRRLLEIRVGPQRQVEKPAETAPNPGTQNRI
jgi:hypothetical protein